MPPTQDDPPNAPSPVARAAKDLMGISNAVLYLGFCLLAATGLVMEFRLDDGASLLGVVKRDWARVHALAALSVLSLVAIHVWVNWPWLRSVFARMRWRTAAIALLGLAMLAVALLAPVR
jgi:hypothetical protein